MTALRSALEALQTGVSVVAQFRLSQHGQFTVSGPVRTDLTDTVLKVGWWDLTNGKKVEPVSELQSLATLVVEDDDLSDLATDDDELRSLVSSLDAGDIVTADFDFEGCGKFTISGGVRRDESASRWVLAGHHLTLGDAHASRLRRLVIEQKATVLVAAGAEYDLFGG
ncbi:hypothetical protein NKG05_26680 [Oerskovia sp. M15]